MGISPSRLCDRRAYRGRIDGEYRMRATAARLALNGAAAPGGPEAEQLELAELLGLPAPSRLQSNVPARRTGTRRGIPNRTTPPPASR
jgi:hypothetical protein